MIKIIYRVSVKEGKQPDFLKLAETVLIPEAKEIAGCRLISFFQNTNNSREFLFYEVWDSDDSVRSYKRRLVEKLGEPLPDEEFPAIMNEMIEEDEDLI